MAITSELLELSGSFGVIDNLILFRLRDNIEELRHSLVPKESALETLQHSLLEKEKVYISLMVKEYKSIDCIYYAFCTSFNFNFLIQILFL